VPDLLARIRTIPDLLWHGAALLSGIALLTGLVLLAIQVSGHERVPIGTEADRIYIVDGFYDPERTDQHGPYRWSQPLGQIILPNWGPGRINVSISGVGAGVAPSEAVLEIEGVPLDRVETTPGQPWRVSAWGDSTERTPRIYLSGPRLDAPGEGRELGRLVQQMEIFAPDARMRALFHLGLLAAGSLLLYLCVWLWTARPLFALIVGVAALALFGPLAVFRDRWVETIAWGLPVITGGFLLLYRLFPSLRANRLSRRWRTALALISLSAALLLLALGYLNAFDSERMYQVSAGLAEYGLPTRYPGRETWTKYGFGQPLIAVPFYYLGKAGEALGGDYGLVTRFAVSLTNLPLTALLLWVLYRACRRFAGVSVSLAVCATFLLSTLTLNYARTFFSEPAGALLLLAALLLIVPRRDEAMPGGGRILLAGACLGAMILLKPAFVIYWPAPGLAVLWLAWKSTGDKSRSAHRQTAEAPTDPSVPDRSVARRLTPVIRMGALFAIGPVMGGLIQIGYNYLRYWDVSNPLFRTGYEREEGFTTPLFEGLYGLLFSPGKSLFLYAPVLILAPIGLIIMYRRWGWPGRLAALLIIASSIVSLVFNALWWVWSGNFAWGPRLILPIFPLLAWALAPLGEWAVDNLRSGGRQLAARLTLGTGAVLVAAGALTNIPGALVDFQVYYRLRDLLIAGADPREDVTFYDPIESPLLVEPGYMLDGLTAAVHRPSLADTGMPPQWDIIVPGALVLLAIGTLWLATRRVDRA
jgi:hypothetical protein